MRLTSKQIGFQGVNKKSILRDDYFESYLFNESIAMQCMYVYVCEKSE